MTCNWNIFNIKKKVFEIQQRQKILEVHDLQKKKPQKSKQL